MKTIYLIIFFLSFINLFPQEDNRYKDREKEYLLKDNSIEDRAAGIHNAGNIGLFFENRGKLYPRRISQGPSGEFPINSGKNYIFRINPMVGIPGNVIQGRYTENEEWEASYGYHNREVSNIAFSDNNKTWPATGWPIKDANGNPLIKSDQDSYCVYNDSNNTKEILNIEVEQTGYAYGVSFAENILFFKYKITNKSNKNYNDLFFGIYADIDIGNISGGSPEYEDDLIGFDKENNFLYFYDDGKSTEWTGGTTGYFGLSFLSTPEFEGVQLGITDWHYNLYYDDRDIDSVQYGILSSARSLYNSSLGENYFHTSSSSNLHFDDPSTIPTSGLDIVATVSSGPYNLNSGESIEIITAMIAGDNYDELYEYLENAKRITDFNFEISKPPLTPTLSAFAEDSKVTLFWNSDAELSKDNFSGEFDFEGYRLYKSIDKGVKWEELADFDLRNKIGLNTGLEYSFIDTNVTNGFEYWYSVTAYDRGDSIVTSLESPKGNNEDAINLQIVYPNSAALGYQPVTPDNVVKENGNTNYNIKLTSVDESELVNNSYKLKFTYIPRKEIGKLNTLAEIEISDSSKTVFNNYGIEFFAPNRVNFIDLTTNDYFRADPFNYRSGAVYSLNEGLKVKLTDPDPNVSDEYKPKAGDYLTVNFAGYVLLNEIDTVMQPRKIEIGQKNSTIDGIIFEIEEPNPIKNISRIGGTENFNLDIEVSDISLIEDTTYFISSIKKYLLNGINVIDIEIKYIDMSVIDTVYEVSSNDLINIHGLSIQVIFDSNNPPSSGNAFSVETETPILPNVKDVFSWKLKESDIDYNKVNSELSGIKVVPNPYIAASLYEPEFGELRKEPLRQIQFINLPNECTIYIFTVDADLIKTIYHNSLNGTEIWDLRTEGGRELAPGIYMYLVKTKNSEFMSRFAIIK